MEVGAEGAHKQKENWVSVPNGNRVFPIGEK